MSNELKLSLENFQSISHGELLFNTGTTVIIGQSNSGKTATFRALKACLSNPSGSQRFIKDGSKQAAVTLEYEGNQITWKRTSKESTYVINGETFYKTGNSNAFKILEDTGFVRDDNDTIMNIEEELQLPFPFGVSKSELFKLFENVFCVSDSAIILKSAKEQEEKVKGDISLLETNLSKNQNKLKELREFKQFVDLDKLKGLKEHLVSRKDRMNFLKEGLPLIKSAIKVEEISLEGISQSFANQLPQLKELIDLQKEIKKLKELHIIGKNLPKYTVNTGKLNQYNSLRETLKISENLKELEKIEIPEVTFEDKLQEYNSLKNYLKDLKDLQQVVKGKKEQLKRVEDNLKELNNKLEGYDVCPLCHRPFERES